MAMPSTGLCPKCARRIEADWRVCPACAAPLDGATHTVFAQTPSSSSTIEEGRFPGLSVLAAAAAWAL
jgi:predicted amidophosphoribosyltransferase